MLIGDPNTTRTIDVTGWDLDHLNTLLTSMIMDSAVGSDRELTDEEQDALTGPTVPRGLPDTAPPDGYALGDTAVTAAIDGLSAVIGEAMWRRDLSAALTRLAGGRELTINQRLAYDVYTTGLGR